MRHFGRTQTATSPIILWLRSLMTLAALVLGVVAWTDDAEARFESEARIAGGGVAAYTLPQLAPPHSAPLHDDVVAANPAQPGATGGSLGELFNRPSLLGGFAAGFLGAGVLGLVFGKGLISELGGPASFLGLFCQIALLAMLLRVIWTWWHGARDSTFTDLSPRQLADAYGRPRHEMLPSIDSPATGEAEPQEADARKEQE